MATAIMNLLSTLLPLLSKGVDWFFSPERITARDARRADNALQDFDKALKDNDSAYVAAAAGDLHNRVRNALRRH